MLREVMLSSYMAHMSSTVGTTCDMGKDGRTAIDIGNGWTEHERPDGRRFFVHETGKRTWSRPRDALPETDFRRCDGYVQKMKYEGRYPKGVDTLVNDGYDCEAFLTKLYAANEERWGKQEFQAQAAKYAEDGGPQAPLPFFQTEKSQQHAVAYLRSVEGDGPRSSPHLRLANPGANEAALQAINPPYHDRWAPLPTGVATPS